jgi:hypothetical protein
MFDGTAADGVEQLAASLLAHLTPPWSRWLGLRPGHDVPADCAGSVAEQLDRCAERIQGHFDRSNFAVEIHQCFLDLATVGTATLLFRESAAAASSAFRFAAVPASEIFVEGDEDGGLRRVYRTTAMWPHQIRETFPEAVLPSSVSEREAGGRKLSVIETVAHGPEGYVFSALLGEPEGGDGLLASGRFDQSPFIVFRWLKSAGDVYGRSPVMTALPDIKTANKVVEMILKNAAIAMEGIWLVDDDNVFNSANLKLAPGAIIPRSQGGAGLTPLQAPGRFDVSQLVLADLRAHIRHTLLVDRLAPLEGRPMTATEVAERSSETARLLGAVYGRLQNELLTPLLMRAIAILRRRGEIPDIAVDGRTVELQWRSPLARAQARDDVRNTTVWLDQVPRLGPLAQDVIDTRAAARWLARSLGVPGEIVRDDDLPSPEGVLSALVAGRSE